MKKYDDLNALLANDPAAEKMFRDLPQYAKDHIMERAENVRSRDALKGYIDTLLQGDG